MQCHVSRGDVSIYVHRPLNTVSQTAEKGCALAAALEAPLEPANTTVNTWCQRI